MDKCPYCGSQIQENAEFCLYCMRGLNGSRQNKGKKRVIIPLISVISVLLVGALVLSLFLLKDGVDATKGEETKNTETAYGGWPLITTFDDMKVRAVYLTGKDDLSHLWNPNGFALKETVSDDDGDKWQIYETEVYLGGVRLRTHFGGQGREVITSITGLTDENYEDGIRLAECMVSSVYNHTFTNLHGMLTDTGAYPRFSVQAEEEILRVAGMPDPAAEDGRAEEMEIEGCSVVFDEGSAQDGQFLYFEYRSRMCNGKPIYDIIIFHTQDL